MVPFILSLLLTCPLEWTSHDVASLCLYVLSSLISWWRCHVKVLQIGLDWRRNLFSLWRLWSLHGDAHGSIFFMESSAQRPLKTEAKRKKQAIVNCPWFDVECWDSRRQCINWSPSKEQLEFSNSENPAVRNWKPCLGWSSRLQLPSSDLQLRLDRWRDQRDSPGDLLGSRLRTAWHIRAFTLYQSFFRGREKIC